MGNFSNWEQSVFQIINLPFRLIGIVLNLPLGLLWFICKILVLPLFLVLMVFNLIWLVLMGIIIVFSKISQSAPVLRPFSFLLALPFLIIADFIVNISPLPTAADTSSKMMKWEFIEKFPFGLDVFS